MQQTSDNSFETFHAGCWRRCACHRVDDVRGSIDKWIHKSCRSVDSFPAAVLWFRHCRTSRRWLLTRIENALCIGYTRRSADDAGSRLFLVNVVTNNYTGFNCGSWPAEIDRRFLQIRSSWYQPMLPAEWANLRHQRLTSQSPAAAAALRYHFVSVSAGCSSLKLHSALCTHIMTARDKSSWHCRMQMLCFMSTFKCHLFASKIYRQQLSNDICKWNERTCTITFLAIYPHSLKDINL